MLKRIHLESQINMCPLAKHNDIAYRSHRARYVLIKRRQTVGKAMKLLHEPLSIEVLVEMVTHEVSQITIAQLAEHVVMCLESESEEISNEEEWGAGSSDLSIL